MRVALDATPLSVSTGGIRRYTEQLSLALEHAFPADEFTLISDQPFARPQECPPGLKTAHVEARRWWSLSLPRELGQRGIELFHGTDFSVPYIPLRPSVMTLHDLSPWKDPAWQPAADRIRRRTPALVQLGVATMVITPSEAVRGEAIDHFRISPDRVQAIPLAPCPARRGGRGACPVHGDYFLFLGTLEPRKNLALLIEAWRPLYEKHQVQLVLAGRCREDYARPAEEPGLRILGEVGEEQLATLYSGALACVYPSLYEGFGLPVLEAMQHGAAVIASRDPAIREVAGDCAELVDAGDGSGWRNALSAAITNPDWRGGMAARGRARAAQFTWERTARLTREVYEEALARF